MSYSSYLLEGYVFDDRFMAYNINKFRKGKVNVCWRTGQFGFHYPEVEDPHITYSNYDDLAKYWGGNIFKGTEE